MNIAGAFEAKALRVLRAIPGIDVVAKPGGRGRRGDAIVRAAGHRTRIAVEFKQRANAATAWQLVHQAQEQAGLPLLLVAGDITAKAREILQQHGVAVVDGHGNAHIELPGFLYHIEGRKRSLTTETKAPPTRLSGKAGIVAQALLLRPGHHWQVGDLANEAQVSAALAHRVLARLEREEIVVAEGAGPKRVRNVANPTALVDLWAEENSDRTTRTDAYLLAQTPNQLIQTLCDGLERSQVEYALTGAAACGLIAPFITAVPVVEVWVNDTVDIKKLHDAVGTDPVADGPNVALLQAKNDAPLAFRKKTDGLWVVNPFRLYADLLRDPQRGQEQADHLRREVIEFEHSRAPL